MQFRTLKHAARPALRTRGRAVRRGSALALALVVSIVISSLVMVLAWVAGENAQRTGVLSDMDQAYYAAEAGIADVAAASKTRAVASWPTSATAGGYSVSMSWTATSARSVRVTSVATAGSITYTAYATLTPAVAPYVAAVASPGDFQNKNIAITGNVLVAGDFSDTGSGSVNGFTSDSLGSAFVPIDWATLGTLLSANAATGVSGTGKTYDFSTVSGSNKVIKVVGDVVDPALLNGPGTLYVDGNVTFTQKAYLGDSAAKAVSIVSTKNLTFQKNNNTTTYGSLYVKGDFSRGQFSLVGNIYVGGVMNKDNGNTDITIGAAPWFDLPSAHPTSNTFSLTNCTGTLP